MQTTKQVLERQKQQAARAHQAPEATNGGGTAVAVNKPAVTAVALADTRSQLDQYLDTIAPSGIVGRMIKFSKNGQFICPDDDEEIGEDRDFVAVCDATLIGWIKFNEDAPPDRIMGLLYDGFRMPPRETLGDTDESQWETGLSGNPEDPWKHTQYLVLQEAGTSEMFTFTTSSATGRRAVGNLLKHYNRMQHTYGDSYPVVRLKKSGFNHRDERIGWVATPSFAVVGRTSKDSAVKPDTSLKGDLEDEIPTDWGGK